MLTKAERAVTYYGRSNRTGVYYALSRRLEEYRTVSGNTGYQKSNFKVQK